MINIMSTTTLNNMSSLQNDLPIFSQVSSANSNSYASSGSSSSSSFLDYIASITWQTWLILILILALLGINVFTYLAQGTEQLAQSTEQLNSMFGSAFGPLLKSFGYNVLETTKQTVQTANEGVKGVSDVVADTTTKIINKVENKALSPSSSNSSNYVPNTASSSIQGVGSGLGTAVGSGPVDEHQQDSLEKALSDASSTNVPEPSGSMVTGKSGWCFIGQDKLTRTCAQVGVNDMCLSGDVFATQDVCINPSLRA